MPPPWLPGLPGGAHLQLTEGPTPQGSVPSPVCPSEELGLCPWLHPRPPPRARELSTPVIHR